MADTDTKDSAVSSPVEGPEVTVSPPAPVTGPADADANPRQMHLAHARLQPELLAYPLHRLVVINFDVPQVVTKALTLAPRLKAHRHLFLDVRPFHLPWVDNIEDYALALGHTQAMMRIAESTIASEDVPYLLDRRAQLHLEGAAAAGRGILDKKKLKELNHTNNHTELSYDCVGLVELFLAAWPQLESSTGVKMPELLEIRERANRLMLTLGSSDGEEQSLIEATLNRRRAATGLVMAFRKIRAALALVVDDVVMIDELAPPLTLRKRKKAAPPSSSDTDEQDDEFDTAEDDESSEDDDAGDAAPELVAAAKASASGTEVRPGMPGSSPIKE